ncbi:hypothetical protein WN55_00538 [Dufourea novaeangliae]|uniref:Uncharacterized protein n=1 Tax=Dufourea novaeangliae TaxID=178035 RepID=A0A154PDG8_DUFNO|nr:hypothetical protein WN55_00538 [Dufourea novaeangliae]
MVFNSSQDKTFSSRQNLRDYPINYHTSLNRVKPEPSQDPSRNDQERLDQGRASFRDHYPHNSSVEFRVLRCETHLHGENESSVPTVTDPQCGTYIRTGHARVYTFFTVRRRGQGQTPANGVDSVVSLAGTSHLFSRSGYAVCWGNKAKENHSDDSVACGGMIAGGGHERPRILGVVRGVGTVHGPVGIGCGQRVAGWMGIDQPGGQQDAFAGYLLYPRSTTTTTTTINTRNPTLTHSKTRADKALAIGGFHAAFPPAVPRTLIAVFLPGKASHSLLYPRTDALSTCPDRASVSGLVATTTTTGLGSSLSPEGVCHAARAVPLLATPENSSSGTPPSRHRPGEPPVASTCTRRGYVLRKMSRPERRAYIIDRWLEHHALSPNLLLFDNE